MKEFVEKLIERLDKLQEIEGEKCDKYAKLNMGDYVEKYNHGECCYIKAIQIVNQLAEEYNQDSTKKNQWWIPVTERLPEEKGEYLITTSFGVTSALYFPNSKKWVDTIEQYFEYSCVAWQPLPEPYKPKEQKVNSVSAKNACTRIERIRFMSVEEMADKILASTISTSIDFCQEFSECQDLNEKGEEIPDEMCKKCLVKWLNSSVEQQKVIPTKHFEDRFNTVT